MKFPISKIEERPDRQRQEYKGIEELAESLRLHGQIQPIVLELEEYADQPARYFLVAGGRRLRAAKHNGWSEIDMVLFNSLTPFQRQEIELAENVKRSDLQWWEEAKAIFKYHLLREANVPPEFEGQYTATMTASYLGMSQGKITKAITVAPELDRDEKVREFSGLEAAYNYLIRKQERALDTSIEKILADTADDGIAGEGSRRPVTADIKTNEVEPSDEPFAEPLFRAAPSKFQVMQMDFREMAKSTAGYRRYNFIHCDFPYGIKMDTSALQGSRPDHVKYEDSEDIYFELISALLENQDRICYDSCHIMFWFSMKFYEETRSLFNQAGWRVDPFPLSWVKSDGRGILPDPQRGPRRVTETAFLMSRGDRKIVQPVANGLGWPSEKASADHLSEKPLDMLKHFFRMFVDESTEMLDPTAGSGTAIRAALALGAASAIGLELNPDTARIADSRVRDALRLNEEEVKQRTENDNLLASLDIGALT